MKQMLEADLTAFAASARKHVGRDWPRVVVDAFADIAEYARDDVRNTTRQRYDLHSDYITRGIKHYPNTAHQKGRAESALKRFGDMNAAVFLRGSRSPKHSLEFMAHHETGEERDPQNEHIAIPTKTLRAKSFRNTRGKVKKRYKPSELLKRFDASGSFYDDEAKTTISRGLRMKRRRQPGNAFLIRGKGGKPFIVRTLNRARGGKKRDLEFMYILVTRAEIKPSWGFAESVWKGTRAVYYTIFYKKAIRMPSYK